MIGVDLTSKTNAARYIAGGLTIMCHDQRDWETVSKALPPDSQVNVNNGFHCVAAHSALPVMAHARPGPATRSAET